MAVEQQERHFCLVYLLQGDTVLLGTKLRGFGQGRLVGLGGSIEPGESAVAAAAREVFEESGIRVDAAALRPVGTVRFRFPSRPEWSMRVEAFTAREFSGEAAVSDEIDPRWVLVEAIPWQLMWDDARYWLPEVLAGRAVDLVITFADDERTVASVRRA